MNPKLSISETLFGIVMFTGAVLWVRTALCVIICGISVDSVFFLLLGGQLFKIGFAYGDAKDEGEWRKAVADAIARIHLKR